MERRSGLRRHSTSSSSSMRRYTSEEYEEEDVWRMIRSEERELGLISTRMDDVESSRSTSSPLSISTRLPSASRMIPSGAQKHERHHDNDDGMKMMQHSSAPVNIPDWSKIYGSKTQRRMTDTHHHDDHDDDVNDGDDVDGGLPLPPHEWLARKMARSQISSFSVCEGAGRTLKGRDLTRVRHAVLSKTGFI